MTSTRIEPQDATMTVNGLRLHYLDWGEEGRPPFVLLHGFSAMAHFWDGFAAKMRQDYHVYALDQRGHGDSDWSDEYPPEAMPSDLTSFVDQLGLDRFVLMGHSMGGGVAFRYAFEHPERLEQLIIVDSSLPSPDRPPLPNRDNSVQRSLAQDRFESEDAVVAHFQRLNPRASEERLRAVVSYWFRPLPDGRYTYKFDPKLRNRLSGSAEQVEKFRQQAQELRSRVQRITCPTLIIRGGNSDILTPESAKETVEALPNATLVTVPNTGHNVPTDDPRGFRNPVRTWLGLAEV
ncbi:MAG: alpha/beta fold hydrolase [Dehalococcoidia bacterium]